MSQYRIRIINHTVMGYPYVPVIILLKADMQIQSDQIHKGKPVANAIIDLPQPPALQPSTLTKIEITCCFNIG